MAKDKGFDFEQRKILKERYELLDKIGSGGISSVYRARDLLLKRVLALKVLKPDKLKDEHLVRLHREAKAICQLQHSGIIDVYDFMIIDDNVPVLAMEYVDGQELSGIIKEKGPIAPLEAIPIFIQIVKAMVYAHERKILHRDLKPENVLITIDTLGNTRVKVFDFGIAKISDLEDDSITRSGFIVGTPGFISPEQAKNESVDHRSDIYSMGCLMYNVLTGRPPFKGKNLVETVNMQINNPAPTLKSANENNAFPEELEKLISKTLKKSPAERPQSMTELENGLKRIQEELTAVPGEHSVDTIASEPDSPSGQSGLKKTIETSMILLVMIGLLAFPIYFLLSTGPEPKKKNSSEQKLSQLLKENGIQKRKSHQMVYYSLEGKVKDSQLKLLATAQVKRLDLRHAILEDRQFQYLEKLPLKVLDLRDTDIGDGAMKHIGKLTGLETLLLENCKRISPRGFYELTSLKDLVVLSLRGTEVSDDDVKELAELKKLGMLYVSKSPNITDKAVPELLKMKKLVSLRIGGTGVTKKGITKLQEHPNLYFLGLKNLSLEDSQLPPRFNPHLTMIDLSYNQISDVSVPKILALDDLWFVDVRGCPNISATGINRLCTKFNLLDKKLVFSDLADGIAKFAMTADDEWYYNAKVYSDTSWNSEKFRNEYISSDFLLGGKRPSMEDSSK